MARNILIAEEQVTNRALKTIKNDLDKNPSVRAQDNNEVITEGLKFFKASSRLYKLSEKIVRKANKQNLPDEKKEKIIKLSKKVNKLGDEFEKAEDLFDVGRKSEARAMEKQLKNDYMDILKMLKKSEFNDALKSIGSTALMMASMVVPYMLLNKFFPTLSFGAVNKAAAETTSFREQAGLYLKRAGAFALCGLPVKATREIVNTGTRAYDENIIKSLDKKLED